MAEILLFSNQINASKNKRRMFLVEISTLAAILKTLRYVNLCRINFVTSGVGFAEQNMAYCPVFGCLSDSKKNPEEKNIHFFAFPKGHSREQQTRRKIWVEFCKRKAFKPTQSTRVCSLHFEDSAFDPAHSPAVLDSIGYKERTLVRLKKDAVPTLNKAFGEEVTKQGKTSVDRQRRKVINMIYVYKQS